MSLKGLSIGTSGWSYKEWIGPFYKETDKSMLRAYTKVFKTVEIDSTFYRYPSKGAVIGWARYSPEGFLFTAKLPKLITHEKKLDVTVGIEEDLERFIELMEPLSLGGKLGCILIQLPPRFSYSPKQLEDFFKLLPTHLRFAVEFRNHSWIRQETWALLEKYHVAYTIVDEPLLPPEIHVTSDFAYFRWHGRGTGLWYDYEYKSEELEPWIPKVREVADKVRNTYGYFNNHFHGYAVENCLQVLEMLGVLTQEQATAKKHIEEYLTRSAKVKEPKLETFTSQNETDFERLLHSFLDDQRLSRARNIKDSDLTLVKETDERVEAIIREYHIVIDLEEKTIMHDCADWDKAMPDKRLCKHVGKLLLSMNRRKATKILERLSDQKESWQFKPYA